MHFIEPVGYGVIPNALFAIHIKDKPDDFCFLRLNQQTIAFHAGKLIRPVAIGRHGTHKFPLRCRLISTASQSLIDGFQLIAAEHELHIGELLIGFILQIISFSRGKDLTAIGLQHLHNVLCHAITSLKL